VEFDDLGSDNDWVMDEDVDGGIDSYNSFLLRLSLPFLYFVFEGFCDEDLSV
jgi:hypothetical protein